MMRVLFYIVIFLFLCGCARLHHIVRGSAIQKETVNEVNNDRDRGEDIQKDIDELKQNNADFQAEFDRIKSEVTSITGRLEGEKVQIEESFSKMQSALVSLEERLNGIEERLEEVALDFKQERIRYSASGLFQRGKKELRNKLYRQAISSFQMILEKYPKSSLVDDAHYWMGEVYFSLKDYQKAVLEYDFVRKNHPKGSAILMSLFKEALCFNELGSLEEARLSLTSVMNDYPKTQTALKAKSILAEWNKSPKIVPTKDQ